VLLVYRGSQDEQNPIRDTYSQVCTKEFISTPSTQKAIQTPVVFDIPPVIMGISTNYSCCKMDFIDYAFIKAISADIACLFHHEIRTHLPHKPFE
jgi:hypothetical protein